MKKEIIKAAIPSKNLTSEVSVDYPENIGEAIKMWGEQECFDLLTGAFDVRLQGVMRPRMEKGVTAEALQAELGGYKPGMRLATTAVDPMVALKARMANATPEEKKALLAEFRAAMNI